MPKKKNPPKIIAIRHAAVKDLGSFHPVFTQEGLEVHYLEAQEDILLSPLTLEAALVVILGGPMCANEQDRFPFINEEMKLVNKRITAGKPVLGIGLGAQVIAKALGAKIYPADKREIGFRDITLTDAGKKSSLRHFEHAPVLHWHGDTFDLPQGAQLLASTDVCENQAFSYGNVLGLQFHPQVTKQNLEQWFDYHDSEIASTPGISHKKLEQQRQVLADKTERCARWFIKDWLNSVGL
jgi:GMP synthase (glutamine-hydrolysing)